MTKNTKINNEVLELISKNCEDLRRLELGGSEDDYNLSISLEGIEALCSMKANLEVLKF